MNDFDDSRVTLCDGAIAVDGVMVSASRQFTRDPRLGHPTFAMLEAAYRRAWQPRMLRIPEGYKYCGSGLKHAAPFEDAVLPRELFGNDRSRADGKDYLCRECRNALERRRYAREHEGGVRVYRRREQV